MANKRVQQFMLEVNELISSEKEKGVLFEALKRYQSSSDVKTLVSDLKRVLNEPTKLEIFDFVRPLIRPQHQQQYDKMAPAAPGQRLRVINLRRTSDSLGFAVRGGFEHGIGVFVSHVDKGSQAQQRGLKVGDEIVRVNGFTIAEAIHDEVLNLIKGRDDIQLKVTNIGMLPIKQSPGDPVTWQYVEKHATKSQEKSHDERSDTCDGEEVKIFINKRGAPSLGCSIFSGPRTFPGIYIETVRAGSLAEDYGLAVGDQIVQVNNRSFTDIKHKEAIVELMGTKELNMTIKKGLGLPLLNLVGKKGLAPSPPGTVRATSTYAGDDSGDVICEILDDDTIPQTDKQYWEMLHQDFQQIREDELRKITLQQGEGESTTRQEEEQRNKDERLREERRAAEEDLRRQELEAERKVQEPGPVVKEVVIRKSEDVPLDMELEGGLGSPLGGKIVVSDVFYGGMVDKSGEIMQGDEVLKIDGKSLVDVTLAEAQKILSDAEQSPSVLIRLTVVESDLRNEADEMTYF